MNTDRMYAESIAKEYAPKGTDKVSALRKLDRRAKSRANIFGYTFGIAMSLLLGVGMCLAMNVVGDGSPAVFAAGILVGLAGIVGVSVNYFIYRRLLESGKKKYVYEIMQLANEIIESER